jgi:hypothetical protein
MEVQCSHAHALSEAPPLRLNCRRASRGVFNRAPSTLKTGIYPPKMPPNERAEKQAAAQQAVDILHEIATILVSLNPPQVQYARESPR